MHSVPRGESGFMQSAELLPALEQPQVLVALQTSPKALVEQCVLLSHSTQVPAVAPLVEQRVLVGSAVQLASMVHSTQVFVVVLHAGLPATPLQSVFVRHSTHEFAFAPVVAHWGLPATPLQSAMTRH